MSTNVIEQYLWARLPELSRVQQVAEVGQVIRRLPSYLRAERRDRGTFLRAVYRRYAVPTWRLWSGSSTRRWRRTS